MLQDSWRFAFFAIGRGSQAFLNDLIWALTLVPALLALRVTHHQHVFWFVLVWGASATVAACVGPLQARVIPRLTRRQGVAAPASGPGLPLPGREHPDQRRRASCASTAIGLILGLAAVGYVQVASTLMGPFLVIFMGISLVAVPEAARVLRHPPAPADVLRAGRRRAALAALAWGVLLLLVLPTGLGFKLVGPIWRPAYPLIIPVTIR